MNTTRRQAKKKRGDFVGIAAASFGAGTEPYICAAKVAERLGTTIADFLGNHAGYSADPKSLTDQLRSVLDANA